MSGVRRCPKCNTILRDSFEKHLQCDDCGYRELKMRVKTHFIKISELIENGEKEKQI